MLLISLVTPSNLPADPSPTNGGPPVLDGAPLTLAVIVVLILAGPYVRRDAARLLRAAAEVLDTPTRG